MNQKRTVPVLLVLFIATVLMLPTAAAAASSSRTMPDSVEPGEQFTVSIGVSDYGTFGGVVETIPNGFTYGVSTLSESQVIEDGNSIKFILYGETNFEYTVTAANTEGTYTFSGMLKDEDNSEVTVGGKTSIEVSTTGSISASAVRTLPQSVEPGEQFTVSMSVSDYGTFGGVVETIPNGFTYDVSTLSESQVIEDGNSVKFLLYGETNFEYTVTAANTEGTYTFSGMLKDEDNSEVTVGGDTSIDVSTTGSDSASAVRTLPQSVEPGEQFTVSMSVSDYGTFGGVVETIPNGFTYDGSTLSESQVIEDGNSVKFILYGETNFEYTVTAANTEGTYTFSGMLKDEDNSEVTVGGNTAVTVGSVGDGITLLPGWNFVSVPYELDNSSVDYVLADINYSLPVTYYNAATGLSETVSDLEPLKGYWIKNPEEGTQVILGELLVPKATPGVLATLTVYEGWNAIGYTDKEDILSAEVALSAIDGSYITIKGPFDPVTWSYEHVGWNGQTGIISDSGKHVGTDVFWMGTYEAFWVFVTQEDMLNTV